jgi:hypothetical protein
VVAKGTPENATIEEVPKESYSCDLSKNLRPILMKPAIPFVPVEQ